MVSLYRKYRPDNFDYVIGQDHIVRVLKNQIKNNQISHAYLFTGTRGTGKTSVAKIFAKAMNCERPVNGSPCNECETCRSINASYDIVELDAASNNGAESIRDLQDSSKYRPSIGKYKVFIIDEVHMLTIQAFNALLKTLEEPPEHIVFILATTEIQQLPQTVLSRCMKFDFRLVPTRIIADRVKTIFDDIGQKYSDEAVIQIAEAGEGSVRDALSVADMCVSFAGGNILTYDDVLEVLGAGNPLSIIELVNAIVENDPNEAFRLLDDLINSGKSIQSLMRDLMRMFRNLYLNIKVPNANSLLNMPQDLYERLSLINKTYPERILNIIEIFGGIDTKMKYSSAPRVMAEAAVARACDVKNSIDMNGLLVRLKTLENELDDLRVNGTSAQATAAVKKARTAPVKLDRNGSLAELLKSSRENNFFVLHQALKELKTENVKIIDDDILVLEATSLGAYNELGKPENKAFMQGMLMNKFIIKGLEIRNIATKEGVQNGVIEIKRIFANEIVNIIK